eukprot:jgi/Astpho2/8021/fgenesh1_pg.00120_%23_16_t
MRYKALIDPIDIEVIRTGDVHEYMWALVKDGMASAAAQNCVDISTFDIDDPPASQRLKDKVVEVKAVLSAQKSHTELLWLREEYGMCFAWEEKNKHFWQMQHGIFGDELFKKWRSELHALKQALQAKLNVDPDM